jgi:hypothetical protein
MKRGLLWGLLMVASMHGVQAQTPPDSKGNLYPGELLPPGLKELDRAKTLMIGAFPFAYLLSSWGYDIVYYVSNNFDDKYTPWPVGQGTASFSGSMLQEKYKTLIFSSIALAGGLALLDFILGLLEPPPGPKIEPPDAPPTPEG